jgi:hypothetical protein
MAVMYATLTIWSILEVGLGVNHDDVSHAILERVPEGRVCERGSLVGIDLRGLACGRRCECSRHCRSEAVHEVGEVLLAFWAGKGEHRNFLLGGKF